MKKLAMKSALYCLAFVSLVLFLGTVPVLAETGEDEEMIAAINLGFQEMAQVLAAAMEEPEVRLLIQEEVAKKFDGDFNVLYNRLARREMKDGGFFSEKVAEKAWEALPHWQEKTSVDGLFKTMSAAFPHLQIAVPVHFDAWDAANFVPPVAYLPYGKDESEVEALIAFDSRGNELLLDAATPPDFPVVVISLNERVDENGRLRRSMIDKARGNGDWEVHERARIFDDNEGWGQGNPEIYMTWSFQSGYSGQYFPPGLDNENQWYFLNDWIFLWQSTYGSVYTVEFWEQDSGPNDFMGSASVYLGDADGTCYTTSNGDVEFCMGHTPPPCAPVATPQIFIVTSNAHPEFFWSAIPGADLYQIYGSPENLAGYSYLGQTTLTSWTDFGQDIDIFPGGPDGTYYRYKVRAINNGPNCSTWAYSDFSNYVEFAVLSDLTEPDCQFFCEE